MPDVINSDELKREYYARRIKWIRFLITLFQALGLLFVPITILTALGILNEYQMQHVSLIYFLVPVGLLIISIMSFGLAQVLVIVIDIDQNTRDINNKLASLPTFANESGTEN